MQPAISITKMISANGFISENTNNCGAQRIKPARMSFYQYTGLLNAFTHEKRPDIISDELSVSVCPSHPSGCVSSYGGRILSSEIEWGIIGTMAAIIIPGLLMVLFFPVWLLKDSGITYEKRITETNDLIDIEGLGDHYLSFLSGFSSISAPPTIPEAFNIAGAIKPVPNQANPCINKLKLPQKLSNLSPVFSCCKSRASAGNIVEQTENPASAF